MKYLENILIAYEELRDNHLNSLSDFVNSNGRLAMNFHKQNEEKQDLGYNVFELMSDIYHRENFHSDIIFSLLDPRAKHKQGTRYLNEFLNLLNKFSNCNIDLSNYSNANLYREKYKIDILIEDEISKKAIIIENKSNNAKDSGERQIPRYYDQIVNNGYEVDAIVYLTLDLKKEPDDSDWTDNDKKNIKPKLIILRIYNRSDKDLCTGWIQNCIDDTSNSEVNFILKQFGRLLKYLGRNIMNKPLMEDFFDSLAKEDTYKKALSLKNMVDDLPVYIAERIKDRYESTCKTFKNIRVDDGYVVFSDLKNEYYSYSVDVGIEEDFFYIDINDYNKESEKYLHKFHEFLNIQGNFKSEGNYWRHIIRIDNLKESEKQLYVFLDKLFTGLSSLN